VPIFLLASRWYWPATVLLLAAPFLLLIHEIALFLTLPLIAVVYWLAFGERSDSWKTLAIFVVTVVILAILVNVAPVPPRAELYAHLAERAQRPIETLGTAGFWAETGLREAISIVWKRVPKYDLIPFAVFYVPTLAFLGRIALETFGRRGWLAVVGGLQVAPMFFIGLDWARWAALSAIMSAMYLLALHVLASRRQIAEPTQLNWSSLVRLDAGLVLFSFCLPAFGIFEPMTSIRG